MRTANEVLRQGQTRSKATSQEPFHILMSGGVVSSDNRQFAIIRKDGSIEAIVLTRGSEFYCFERCEDAPTNFKEAMDQYPGCTLAELKLTVRDKPELAALSK